MIIEIIAIILSFFAFLAMIYNLYLTRKSLEETKKSVEISMNSLDLFKRDFETRFSPFKFDIFGRDINFILRDNYIFIQINFYNDSAFTNYVNHINMKAYKEDMIASMLFQPISHNAIRVLPGKSKTVDYKGSSLEDYKFVFEGERVKLTFEDRLKNPYTIENFDTPKF